MLASTAQNESAIAYLVRIVSHTQIEGFQTPGVTIIHAYLSMAAMVCLVLLAAQAGSLSPAKGLEQVLLPVRRSAPGQ